MRAVIKKDIKSIAECIASQDALDEVDKGSWTALSFAAAHNYQPAVQLLLDAGADPYVGEYPYKLTSKHEIFELLTSYNQVWRKIMKIYSDDSCYLAAIPRDITRMILGFVYARRPNRIIFV